MLKYTAEHVRWECRNGGSAMAMNAVALAMRATGALRSEMEPRTIIS